MQMIYGVNDRPKFGQLVLFALQQLLAIITATIVVPVLVNGVAASEGVDMVLDPAAALFGAGIGTIVYILFTKRKSPVFLGSSFAFLGSMGTAVTCGYWGIIMGAIVAGLVYVVIALIVTFVGSGWVNKLLPPVIIGPTVALIGLSLAGNAVGDVMKASATGMTDNLIAILCGVFTFFVVVLCSVKGTKGMKLIPFVIGILAGYALASVFTAIGHLANVDYLKIVDYSALVSNFSDLSFTSFLDYPKFTFLHGWDLTPAGFVTVLVAYAPVAFVVLAEHIADHKNISSIIEKDLITDPGLHRTLLGDGVGSMVGGFFGGCPNTTYGESVGCVAITRNASVITIIGAAVLAIVVSFLSPVVAFINSIPSCVMGGVCLALYGFIAVSGLKMLQPVDLNDNKNLFVVSAILIAGIGGLVLNFGPVQITSIATALILGILTNLILKDWKKKGDKAEGEAEAVPADGAAQEAPAEAEAASEGAPSEQEEK